MVLTTPQELPEVLEEIRHLLPVQGPIEVFIHHNTLHSFEHLPFEDAVEEAARIYGARPYLPESRFRDMYLDGQIRREDAEAELIAFLAQDNDAPLIAHHLSRHTLFRRLFYYGLRGGESSVTRWQIAEGRLHLREDLSPRTRRALIHDTGAWILGLQGNGREEFINQLVGRSSPLRDAVRSDLNVFVHRHDRHECGDKRLDGVTAMLLWLTAQSAVSHLAVPHQPPVVHHAQALDRLSEFDLFGLIHPLLIQLCGMFLDQGISHRSMPGRERGFVAAVTGVLAAPCLPTERWLRRATSLLHTLTSSEADAITVLESVLQRLGVSPAQRMEFLLYGALRLKGWAGFFALLERKPETARDRPIRTTLAEFLTVQTIFVLAAVEEAHAQGKIDAITLTELQNTTAQKGRTRYVERTRAQMTQRLFEICQVAGISPRHIFEQGPSLAGKLLEVAGEFSDERRQRTWQNAWERSFRQTVVRAFGNHIPSPPSIEPPIAHVLFCIDEREESIRRHLEEIDPTIETLGYPGFFNLPLAYRGLHHLHAEPLCPIVMEPTIAVHEHDRAAPGGSRTNLLRKLLAMTAQEVAALTRTSVGGSLITTTLGHLSLFPFILRMLKPALAGRVHEALLTPETVQASFRVTSAGRELDDNELRVTIASSLCAVFRTIGRADSFGPIFVVMGHGSSSLNNPHESAHDCGACGGRRGAPSARLFARFANDPQIRTEMARQGVVLPDELIVVGAYHDTCDDSISIFDEELIPAQRIELAHRVIDACRVASARNAVERSRRFLTASHSGDPDEAAAALLHRAEDLSEPRPEYGHATNALAFVGRRARCLGLFLDRRAFLSSYDQAQDSDGSILESLLAAIVPVCAGINLEYYFSMVDPAVYGCGTKLPHNIVGQIGVMDGSSSDLRTGLPWQMVEIHEPVRLVMVVEATTKRLCAVLERLPRVKNLLNKRWFWLLAMDPERPLFARYEDGMFVPCECPSQPLAKVSDSLSYCIHTSQALPFASVQGEAFAAPTGS